jgi:transposase
VRDAPVSDRPVLLRLMIRRFKCVNPGCEAVTFAEQIPDLTCPFGRYTPTLAAWCKRIGLALAGRAGARLAVRLGAPVSRQTLLRRVMALPDPCPDQALEICGIDDFALRKGCSYGTVMVNLGSNRVVDLLPERTAEPVAAWLREHGADIAVVCRDRASAYAEAARTATPQAIQVADRWHLWHNLCQAVTKDLAAHRGCMQPREEVPAQPAPIGTRGGTRPTGVIDPDSPLATRIRERHRQIHDLLGKHWTKTQIIRHLDLDFKTVTRYANAEDVTVLLGSARRPMILDPYRREVARLWNQGITDGTVIHQHLTALGFSGSTRTVRRMLEPHRDRLEPMPAQIAAPKTGTIARWITTRPETLTEQDHEVLAELSRRCPHLGDLRGHVEGFAKMLTARTGTEHLDTWISTVREADFTAMSSFARGLTADYDAVLAGLSLPYSSGPVEGTVNRIKYLKRQMFGRASFPLLRKRVLLTE